MFSHVFVFVFVFACVFVFVIVVTGASLEWIVRVMSFRNMMVIWVCKASEVNNLTELAVGPNSLTDNNDNDKFASSGSDR